METVLVNADQFNTEQFDADELHGMSKALVLGGSGQIGYAISKRFSGEGWDVALSSRHTPKFIGSSRHIKHDMHQSLDLATALNEEFDLLVSCIAFDASDSKQLLELQSHVKRIVVISSASVYQDSSGRTLDEAQEGGFPDFDGPLTEATQTVPPGPQTYSTRKIAMENMLLENATVPVTVLRPCAIHGTHNKHAREWWFVKRLLDGRHQIPLAYNGQSRFQTTSASAIADVILRSTTEALPAVINVADSDSPSVKEIGCAIIKSMNSNAELVGLPDESYPASFGASPWSIPRPFVCESVLRSTDSYAETVPEAVNWLIDEIYGRQWQELLPQLASYPYSLFDYRNDDEALLKALISS